MQRLCHALKFTKRLAREGNASLRKSHPGLQKTTTFATLGVNILLQIGDRCDVRDERGQASCTHSAGSHYRLCKHLECALLYCFCFTAVSSIATRCEGKITGDPCKGNKASFYTPANRLTDDPYLGTIVPSNVTHSWTSDWRMSAW